MQCSNDRPETYPMNGALSLIRTLVGGGVDVCFANAGTSEMHFVASLDAVPEMRAVLALFEGVVTGAADGYGRMAERVRTPPPGCNISVPDRADSTLRPVTVPYVARTRNPSMSTVDTRSACFSMAAGSVRWCAI